MRTINATLLTNQKSLSGNPTCTLLIGTATAYDASAYVLEYEYNEPGSLTIVLDNSAGTFNSLPAKIAQGAQIELKRGLEIAGTTYLEELPRTWIEEIIYDYGDGKSTLVLECIDWWEKLQNWHATSDQEWSATSATTILEWILTQVGMTRASGSMTALTLDFSLKAGESGATILNRLTSKMPEYLYPGLDAEIKWKQLTPAEASTYTFGWNAQHPVLSAQAGDAAWKYNKVVVNGLNGTTGSDEDATQIAAVGTRQQTITDADLDSNAECTQRASAELDLYTAGASEMTLTSRPCHGLETYDVIKMDNPPWGGSDATGRVIAFSETYKSGTWIQVINTGIAADKPGGTTATGSIRVRWFGRRWIRRLRRLAWRVRRLEHIVREILESIRGGSGAYGTIPVGGIILFSGATTEIPPDWTLCNGSNGTPDLRDKFVVGAGSGYGVGDTGGEASSDLQHSHADGTLATDADSHSHDVTGDTATSGNHSHDPGTLAIDNDTHDHHVDEGTSDDYSGAARNVAAGTDYAVPSGHTHGPGDATYGYDTDDDTHNHNVSGATATTGSHSHADGTLATDADSHSHDVTGDTANAGSTTQENRPPYYALAYIMRVS